MRRRLFRGPISNIAAWDGRSSAHGSNPASLSQAATEIETIGHALAQEHPEQNAQRGLRVARASLIPGNLAIPLAGVFTLLLGFVSVKQDRSILAMIGLLDCRSIKHVDPGMGYDVRLEMWWRPV